ncbi:hypothetical protein [Streptomyces sp. NBC_00091]|uniref:hypothetical protein n=1 Tax=Streptomyces sp. NBC_00091 TaxID=2975648 RepID=UPI002257C71C|nr:hypothetical protein [Streptomyces sp. NBC_00091]MCX5376728.1 hypothetical protein [Streptomyces sp. NBC_00091]
MTLIPALQHYVDRLPLEEFEQSDWVTLHADLVSYLAEFLIRRYGASWEVADDPDGPVGYQYVIEATGFDGVVRRVDPFAVVAGEFQELPVEVVRMLATAEYALGLTVVVE